MARRDYPERVRHFTYTNLDELCRAADALGAAHVKFEPDPDKVRATLARPVRAGRFTIGNAMAVQPMEGCDGDLDGRPGELTWRRYERFARGGCKLVWFEATAVCEQGRANTRQLWIRRQNLDEFARVMEMVRRVHREEWGTSDDLLVPLQLTHSGRYSVPTPVIAYHHPHIDRKNQTPPDLAPITDDELSALEDRYLEAARLAAEAGFNAVDIKATHGYLLSELLGARTRPGCYGGSLENRTRFIRNVIGKIRAELGGRLMIVMRLGCYDGVPYFRDPASGIGVPCDFERPYPYGFGVNAANPLLEDLAEVQQAIGWFRQWGVELINVSLGSPYYNPHIGRPFEKPDEGNYEQPEHPLLGVDRHFRIGGQLQLAFPGLPMVGTGYSWLQQFAINAGASNVARGAIALMGIGRGVLAYPDYARDVLEKGELDGRRVCKTLTYCTWLMRQKHHELGQFPTGCPPFDKDPYGKIIKVARAAKPKPPAK